MGYCLNRLDEPVFMTGPKPKQTEFSIHQRLENCVNVQSIGSKVVTPTLDVAFVIKNIS